MKTNIPYEDFGFELVFPGDAREEEKLSDLSLLSPLTRNGTVVSYYLSDLRKKWIDICIDESKTPEEMNGFSISKILPYLYREDARVDIEQDETHLDDLIEETLFITENGKIIMLMIG